MEKAEANRKEQPHEQLVSSTPVGVHEDVNDGLKADDDQTGTLESSKKQVEGPIKNAGIFASSDPEKKCEDDDNGAAKTPVRKGKKGLHLNLMEDSTKKLHLTPTLSSLVSPRGTGFRILESVFSNFKYRYRPRNVPKVQ